MDYIKLIDKATNRVHIILDNTYGDVDINCFAVHDKVEEATAREYWEFRNADNITDVQEWVAHIRENLATRQHEIIEAVQSVDIVNEDDFTALEIDHATGLLDDATYTLKELLRDMNYLAQAVQSARRWQECENEYQ
jgi:hypothetical protein